jgi:hypothetical protein
MPVKKLGILLNVLTLLVQVVEVALLLAEVLYERLVLIVVDLELYLGIGKLRKLNGLFEEAYSAFFECDATNSIVSDMFNFNLFTTHKNDINPR